MHAATTGPGGSPGAPESPDADGVWVTQHEWVRRPLGPRFWVGALLIPLVLTALVAASQAPAIEQTTQHRAERALQRAGLDAVRVAVDGRRVLAQVPRRGAHPKVRATLTAVPGIWLVGTVPLSGSPRQARSR